MDVERLSRRHQSTPRRRTPAAAQADLSLAPAGPAPGVATPSTPRRSRKAVQFGSRRTRSVSSTPGLIPHAAHAAGGAVAELVAQERAGRGIGRKGHRARSAGSRRFIAARVGRRDRDRHPAAPTALQAQIRAVLNPLSEPGDYPDPRGSDRARPALQPWKADGHGRGQSRAVDARPSAARRIQLKAPTRALEFDIPGGVGPLPGSRPAPLSSRPRCRRARQNFQAGTTRPRAARGLEDPFVPRLRGRRAVSSNRSCSKARPWGHQAGRRRVPRLRDVLDARSVRERLQTDNVSPSPGLPVDAPEKRSRSARWACSSASRWRSSSAA